MDTFLTKEMTKLGKEWSEIYNSHGLVCSYAIDFLSIKDFFP